MDAELRRLERVIIAAGMQDDYLKSHLGNIEDMKILQEFAAYTKFLILRRTREWTNSKGEKKRIRDLDDAHLGHIVAAIHKNGQTQTRGRFNITEEDKDLLLREYDFRRLPAQSTTPRINPGAYEES